MHEHFFWMACSLSPYCDPAPFSSLLSFLHYPLSFLFCPLTLSVYFHPLFLSLSPFLTLPFFFSRFYLLRHPLFTLSSRPLFSIFPTNYIFFSFIITLCPSTHPLSIICFAQRKKIRMKNWDYVNMHVWYISMFLQNTFIIHMFGHDLSRAYTLSRTPTVYVSMKLYKLYRNVLLLSLIKYCFARSGGGSEIIYISGGGGGFNSSKNLWRKSVKKKNYMEIIGVHSSKTLWFIWSIQNRQTKKGEFRCLLCPWNHPWRLCQEQILLLFSHEYSWWKYCFNLQKYIMYCL